MEVSSTPTPAKEDPPFYRRAGFWTGPFLWGTGLILAAGLAVAWYVLGGFPADHDKYGEVAVPGQAVLTLPGEEVRLNFENHATHSGDSTSIDDQPPGLDVQVTPAAGGEPLKVSDVPSFLFSSTTNDRGHEPWGKVDVPSAGDYLIQTADESAPFRPIPAATQQAQGAPTDIGEGAAISVGAAPWNPLGSKLLGAILCFVAVMAVILLLTLPFRLVGMRG